MKVKVGCRKNSWVLKKDGLDFRKWFQIWIYRISAPFVPWRNYLYPNSNPDSRLFRCIQYLSVSWIIRIRIIQIRIINEFEADILRIIQLHLHPLLHLILKPPSTTKRNNKSNITTKPHNEIEGKFDISKIWLVSSTSSSSCQYLHKEQVKS